MKYILSTKGFTPDVDFSKTIDSGVAKLSHRLVNLLDYVLLTMMIKKHDKHTFYTGHMVLRLIRKSLVANVSGHNELELLGNGFTKLLFEFEKYKGKHFKGTSTYPNHASIRKGSLRNA